jgi:4-diphosphocytidyl-2-C-methyl-D-erythritol kinase
MNQTPIECPAKINLFLELHGKRQDGFHEIATVMTPINLCDLLRVQPSRTFSLHVQGAKLTGTNTLERVYQIISRQRKIPPVRIDLHKKIPPGAGLGGGSSNAATLIMTLDKMFDLDLDQHSIAKEIGSDVPFFLQRSPALCTGRGEKIHPLETTRNLPITLFFPPVEALTKEVYARVKKDPNIHRKSESQFIQTYNSAPPLELAKQIFNRLQEPAFERYPTLQSWKRKLGSDVHLTGSGSTFFQIHSDPKQAEEVARKKGGLAISTLSPFPPSP